MVDPVKEIIENSYPDVRIDRIIRAFNVPTVSGRSFKYKENAPPAFTLGFNILQPFGMIYVSDRFLDIFNEKEIEWILLHELAHIYNNHIGWGVIADYISMFSAEYLSEILEVSPSFGEFIIKTIRALVTSSSGGITREFELYADEWAAASQGTTMFGISVLNKMSGGDLDIVSHVSTGYCFEVPALTIRQRIDALRNLTYLG